jgi:hypothetical protein
MNENRAATSEMGGRPHRRPHGRAGRRRVKGSWRLPALVIAATSSWLGCGGGSPSDVVLPDQVDVTLTPLEAPVPRSVGLELAAASGRDLSLQVVGQGLEAATGVAFELRYDPGFLEFTGAGPGTFFGPAAVVGASVVEAAPGRLVGVAAGADQVQGRSGSGTLLTLQFRLRQLRDVDLPLIFEVPESLVYGPDGVAGQHVFTSAQLISRIRAPS